MRPHIARGTFSRSEYSEPPKVLPQPAARRTVTPES